MSFTTGETVYFDSKTAGGQVIGEYLRTVGATGIIHVTDSPSGCSYPVGKSFAVPLAKLRAIDLSEPAGDLAPVSHPNSTQIAPVSHPPQKSLKRAIRGPLVDHYRPVKLSDVRGQADAVDVLTEYAKAPYPAAFLLSGPTGTGKTSAARALAAELGVDVDNSEFGGLYEIASGEQNGGSVRESVRKCYTRPMMGSGWKVLIVNEADCMTDAAAFIWLDVLEKIPASTTILFTTNDPGKLPQRLRDRCVSLEFAGDTDSLRPALQSLARDVWRDATGKDDCPSVDSFGGYEDRNGDVSFRRLLQRMEPFVRTGRKPQTVKGCAA